MGRGRCIGYNLSHMAHLKKTTPLSYYHSIIALWLFHVIKHIFKHINETISISFICYSKIWWIKCPHPEWTKGLCVTDLQKQSIKFYFCSLWFGNVMHRVVIQWMLYNR